MQGKINVKERMKSRSCALKIEVDSGRFSFLLNAVFVLNISSEQLISLVFDSYNKEMYLSVKSKTRYTFKVKDYKRGSLCFSSRDMAKIICDFYGIKSTKKTIYFRVLLTDYSPQIFELKKM